MSETNNKISNIAGLLLCLHANKDSGHVPYNALDYAFKQKDASDISKIPISTAYYAEIKSVFGFCASKIDELFENIRKNDHYDVFRWLCIKIKKDNNDFESLYKIFNITIVHFDPKYFKCLHALEWPHRRACSIAASNQKLEMLKCLREYHYPWGDELFLVNCIDDDNPNDLTILKWAIENGCPKTKEICIYAATTNNMVCMKYLIANNFPLPMELNVIAIKNGHFDMMHYIIDTCGVLGNNVLPAAAESGNIEIYNHLLKLGAPLKPNVYLGAIRNNNIEMVRYLIANNTPRMETLIAEAIIVGNLEIVKLLHESGFEFSKFDATESIKLKSSDILQYLHENNCPWDPDNCRRGSIAHDSVECYKYMTTHVEATDNEENHEDPKDLQLYAASDDAVNILEYMDVNNIGDRTNVCAVSAGNGHLKCLKYACTHNYPIDELAGDFAAKGEHYDCLKYLIEHDHPVSPQAKVFMLLEIARAKSE